MSHPQLCILHPVDLPVKGAFTASPLMLMVVVMMMPMIIMICIARHPQLQLGHKALAKKMV